MVSGAMIHTRIQEIYTPLAASMLLMMLCCVKGQSAPASSQSQVRQPPVSSGPLVIQGRITAIQGALVMVKMPDGYPGGGPGIHAQVVMAGPTFKVDVSRARVLLADGRGLGPLTLAVGDRVLMVLNAQDSGSNAPNGPANINPTYSASIVERLVVVDKVISH